MPAAAEESSFFDINNVMGKKITDECEKNTNATFENRPSLFLPPLGNPYSALVPPQQPPPTTLPPHMTGISRPFFSDTTRPGASDTIPQETMAEIEAHNARMDAAGTEILCSILNFGLTRDGDGYYYHQLSSSAVKPSPIGGAGYPNALRPKPVSTWATSSAGPILRPFMTFSSIQQNQRMLDPQTRTREFFDSFYSSNHSFSNPGILFSFFFLFFLFFLIFF